MKSMIGKMAMIITFIAITGGFTYSYAQASCKRGAQVREIFNDALWRQPTASEFSFWLEKMESSVSPKVCYLNEEGRKKFISSIMDQAIADPKEPRFQTTEVSRMVDRVFEKATAKPAAQQEHAVWDNIVRNQKTTAPELFARITSDLIIKEVVDIPNDAKAVNVHLVNQGKFSTRLGSTLLLEINNGPGCTGKVSKQVEFSAPVLKAGEDIWVKVISTERLKLSGLERLAYKLTADAKKSVFELDETNNEKCVPAYIIK